MRLGTIAGEHYFKALYQVKPGAGWELTEKYFVSMEDATNHFKEGLAKGLENITFHWPAEVDPSGYVFIPDAEETN